MDDNLSGGLDWGLRGKSQPAGNGCSQGFESSKKLQVHLKIRIYNNFISREQPVGPVAEISDDIPISPPE